MEYTPLIPSITESHDVAHVISECFQDAITEKKQFPSNLARNFKKYNVDSKNLKLKECGKNSMIDHDRWHLLRSSLNYVETKLMTDHAKFIAEDENINEDKVRKEKIKLKRDGLFENFSFNGRRIGLLRKEDILPNIYERSVDFIYKPQQCENLTPNRGFTTNDEFHQKIADREIILPQLPHESTACKGVNKSEEKLKISFDKQEACFRLLPDQICFDDFELNVTYKRKFKLINASGKRRSFHQSKLKHPAFFSVKCLTNVDFLASGMKAEFIVTFKTEIYQNLDDWIIFETYGSLPAKLRITSYRAPPILKAYFYKTVRHIPKVPFPGILVPWTNETSRHRLLECDHCFVGDARLFTLVLKNVGKTATFCILPEEVWEGGNVSERNKDGTNDAVKNPVAIVSGIKEIDSDEAIPIIEGIKEEDFPFCLDKITHCRELTQSCFSIYPNAFTIEEGSIFAISIIFMPYRARSYLEKFHIISNTNMVNDFTITGTGLYFGLDAFTLTYCRSMDMDVVPIHGNEEEPSLAIESEHCIFLQEIENDSVNVISIQVKNNYPLHFNYYWILENVCPFKTITPLDASCVKITCFEPVFEPYETRKFDITVIPKVQQEGYHNIYVSLFIEGIPETCLSEETNFYVQRSHCRSEFEVVDVRFVQLELACYVVIAPPTIQLPGPCECPSDVPPIPPQPKVKFSTHLLEFGLLPLGVTAKRMLHIENLTEKQVTWRIIEIMYDIDIKPSMKLVTDTCLSCSMGTLLSNQKICLTYSVQSDVPRRRVVILLLQTYKKDRTPILNSTCLITYEVIPWDIHIFTDMSNLPIICPMELQYITIPSVHTVYVQNRTVMTGCFWFMHPVGEHVNKISIQIAPTHGILKPMRKVIITVTLTPLEVGIIEHVYIPCWIGKYTRPIMLKVLCATDDINVYFYLPNKEENFDKIIWPPKILNEFDFNISSASVEGSCEPEHWINDIKLEETSSETCGNDQKKTDSLEISEETTPYSSLEMPYSGSSCSYFEDRTPLKDLVLEKFGSQFCLQDVHLEIKNVHIRRPMRLSFFIENTTPLTADFQVEAQNFEERSAITEEFVAIAPTPEFRNDMLKWEQSCSRYGIAIFLEKREGKLEKKGIQEVGFWIYATTWGVYAEEIITDIGGIMPFNFSIIIEVVGLPLEFPMAANTIRKYPTVRFGMLPFGTEPVTRKVKIKNTSSIPIFICWHLFNENCMMEKFPFNVIINVIPKKRPNVDEIVEDVHILLTNKHYGGEDMSFMKITPLDSRLEPNETSFLEITIDPKNFPIQLYFEPDIKCHLIGHIYLEKENSFLENYYFRRHREKLRPIHAMITGKTVTTRGLEVLSKSDNLSAFVTEIFEQGGFYEGFITVVFKNCNLTKADVAFHIEHPFKITDIKSLDSSYIEGNNRVSVKPDEGIVVTVKCNLKYDYVLNMADWVFTKPHEGEGIKTDTKHKVVELQKSLLIRQREVLEQAVNLSVCLYYPKLSCKPKYLKFENVLLGNTKKMHIAVFNHTGAEVKFEVYKTCQTNEIKVKPHFGKIPKAIGDNKMFADIFVYFTPRECKFYQESIKVCTSLPQSYIIIPLNGHGSNNEKFKVLL